MTKAKALDLSALSPTKAADKGYELELRNPFNDEPLGVFISVVGKEGSVYRNHMRERLNEKLAMQFKRQRQGKDEPAPTVEQVEREAIELLAVCTTGWRNVTYEGEELPFTEGNARRLYGEKWIREQVNAAMEETGNFTPD